jgi:hypothetical protein
MFLGAATFLFETAERLASDGRSGWGWFLVAGLMHTAFTLNLWTGEVPTPRCPNCRKPCSQDLE